MKFLKNEAYKREKDKSLKSLFKGVNFKEKYNL